MAGKGKQVQYSERADTARCTISGWQSNCAGQGGRKLEWDPVGKRQVTVLQGSEWMRLVLNSRRQKPSSMMPVENWDGAELRGVSAGLGCRLLQWRGWRAAFLPVCPLESAAGHKVCEALAD